MLVGIRKSFHIQGYLTDETSSVSSINATFQVDFFDLAEKSKFFFSNIFLQFFFQFSVDRWYLYMVQLNLRIDQELRKRKSKILNANQRTANNPGETNISLALSLWGYYMATTVVFLLVTTGLFTFLWASSNDPFLESQCNVLIGCYCLSVGIIILILEPPIWKDYWRLLEFIHIWRGYAYVGLSSILFTSSITSTAGICLFLCGIVRCAAGGQDMKLPHVPSSSNSQQDEQLSWIEALKRHSRQGTLSAVVLVWIYGLVNLFLFIEAFSRWYQRRGDLSLFAPFAKVSYFNFSIKFLNVTG